ncbi:MAG: type I methionyl aminopeptidase, partial [Candidatus Puniceispirillaceae bacterium]
MRSEPVMRHTEDGFAGMRAAGRLAAEVLDMIAPHIVAGVTTEELDRLCHEYILAHGALPAPLNYKGFPKSTCISLNHVVCHGIPGPKTLRSGDILNIDVTVILDSWYGDTSRMFFVGTPSVKAKLLSEVTYECLMRGIAAARAGNTLGDIGHAIQSYAEAMRFSVVRDFTG